MRPLKTMRIPADLHHSIKCAASAAGITMTKFLRQIMATVEPVKNINEKFGDPLTFLSVGEMAAAIRKCGYKIPADGLVEGRDYEVIR